MFLIKKIDFLLFINSDKLLNNMKTYLSVEGYVIELPSKIMMPFN